MTRKTAITVALAIVVSALIVPVRGADALPILRLTSGSTSITIMDNGVGDSQSLVDGLIEFEGVVGSFYVTGTFGQSKPFLDGSNKIIGIDSIDISSPIYVGSANADR